MKNSKLICVLLGLLLLLSSCGSSYIVTDRGNDIYVNGQKEGTEKVRITRTGFPSGSDIDIKQGNKIVNSQRLKRRFTVTTGVCTLLFGWVGVLFSWQYPKSTYMQGRKEQSTPNSESIWSKPPKDNNIWE